MDDQFLKGGSVFSIDKGVPIPAETGETKIYPWKEMEVGDSFLVPNNHTHPHQATQYRNRKHPVTKFICRKTPDGYRIWRTA